jgi:DNA-binding CsgD family transcriptional regulator
MDQLASTRLRANEQLEQVVSALDAGIIFVDADGQIVWMDERTRRRVNGDLKDLVLPMPGSDGRAVGCFVSTTNVAINGEPSIVCVLQESPDQKESGFDVVAAVEAVMADTSWLTRTIVEKLRALRHATWPSTRPSELDLLSDREREVLGLICEGRSDRDMSRVLNLSQNTVRNHIASLYRKIGVNRRSAAIIWARERAITSQEALGLRGRKRSQQDAQAKMSSH